MKITMTHVTTVLDRAIADQKGYLSASILMEDWSQAAERDAYLRGLVYAKELVNLLRIEED